MMWLSHNWGQVIDLAITHLALTVPAVLLALLISVPTGRLCAGNRSLARLLLPVLSVLYAIPSLPLLVVVPVILGTGLRSPVNLTLVLAVYGVAILVGQCAQAFRALAPDVLEACEAMGMGPWRRFWSAELPLALPVIAAGIRVVTASTVSLVTVGAVIGVQSLGTLFTDGFQRGLHAEILTGVAATLMLAILLDLLIVLFTRVLTPWRRKVREVGR